MSERTRLRVLGVAMVSIILLSLALTVAFYNQLFRPTVHVKVAAERVGLQLLPHSDVKVRGLIVGEVRDTEVSDDGAILHLALDPEQAELIPRNVKARMLPKTLFGEKYVSLEIPENAAYASAGDGLTEGTTIQQDRSRAAVEINKLLDDLLPLLQAVKPAELNATLTALSTALQGRGDQLGKNLEQADALLKKVNPELGTLVDDLHGLADVADVYDQAAPDLLQTLRNLNVTSKTITDKEQTIEDLIPAVTALSEDGDTFMRQNGPKIIGLNIANRDVLQVVAKYSPSFPCVLKQMVQLKPELERIAGANGSKTYNLTIEIVKPRPAYKNPLDKPEAKDRRNPRCYGMPNYLSPDAKVPFPDYLALDGTQDDLWWKDPGPANAGGGAAAGQRGRALSSVFVDTGAMNDTKAIKNIVGPLTKTPSDELSDVSALMFGPLLQGSVVTVE